MAKQRGPNRKWGHHFAAKVNRDAFEPPGFRVVDSCSASSNDSDSRCVSIDAVNDSAPVTLLDEAAFYAALAFAPNTRRLPSRRPSGLDAGAQNHGLAVKRANPSWLVRRAASSSTQSWRSRPFRFWARGKPHCGLTIVRVELI